MQYGKGHQVEGIQRDSRWGEINSEVGGREGDGEDEVEVEVEVEDEEEEEEGTCRRAGERG
jgi:hypothetical protein